MYGMFSLRASQGNRWYDYVSNPIGTKKPINGAVDNIRNNNSNANNNTHAYSTYDRGTAA